MRAYAAALALLLPLAACGPSDADDSADADADDAAASAATGETTAEPTTGPGTGPAWNPCLDLAAGRVSAKLGTKVTRETGSAAAPRCAFLPEAEDGPTLNVTYLWFDGGFERAWASMGRIDGRVTDVDLAGADAARLVVNATRKAVLVTGFVQTGALIETVNAIHLAPYDRDALVAAATDLMTTLSRRAPASPEDAAARG